MGKGLETVGRVNSVLLPALRGYAGCGLAGSAAAVYCAVTGASPELAGVLVPVAVALGERLERLLVAAWELLRVRLLGGSAAKPGTVLDTSGGLAGVPPAKPPYAEFIKGYCTHDGLWLVASVGVRNIGMAKGGGFWKAETLDGRIYDLDQDCWI